MEIRTFSCERAMPTIIPDSRNIEGYGIVFDKESRVMFDMANQRFFVEIIRSGAVSQEDIAKWDIKALVEHNKNRLVARSFNGRGSLSLSVDDYGLKYSFEAPQTQEGENLISLVSRRDIFGSSFAYLTDEKKNVKYSKRDDGVLLREVFKIDAMFDVSPVSDPAYFGTDVNTRSLEEYFPSQDPPNTEYLNEIEELRSLMG